MLRNAGPYLWSTLILLASTAACTPPPAEPKLQNGPGTAMTVDGNRMPYTVGGIEQASTSVVFIHCWMCGQSFWREQLPALAADYRTVTLDLPGHGEAGSRRAVWTIEGFAEDVAELIRELDLQDVILVGHSMGGPVALRTAALLPERIRGIVAVDTLHNAESSFENADEIVQAFAADFTGTCNRMIDAMFPEEGVEATIEHVRNSACVESRREAGLALMQDFGRIDMSRWFQEAGVPIRAINANSPMNPTAFETNRKYADFDAVLMDDVGHYLQMTRPEAFNDQLLAALKKLRPKS